jgi:hypothetical protein
VTHTEGRDRNGVTPLKAPIQDIGETDSSKVKGKDERETDMLTLRQYLSKHGFSSQKVVEGMFPYYSGFGRKPSLSIGVQSLVASRLKGTSPRCSLLRKSRSVVMVSSHDEREPKWVLLLQLRLIAPSVALANSR